MVESTAVVGFDHSRIQALVPGLGDTGKREQIAESKRFCMQYAVKHTLVVQYLCADRHHGLIQIHRALPK